MPSRAGRARSARAATRRRARKGLLPGLTLVAAALSVCATSFGGGSRPFAGPARGQMVLAGYGTSAESGSGGSVPAMVGRATVGFRISGTVTGLYPGGTRPLVLTVTNRESVAITVTALSTIVTAASTLCLGANVKVTSFTGSLPVAAGGQATTTVQAKMVHAAPVACEGVTFPFVYRGQAVAP